MPSNFSLQMPEALLKGLDAVQDRYGVAKSVVINRLLDKYLSGTLYCPGLPGLKPGELAKPMPRRRGTGEAP